MYPVVPLLLLCKASNDLTEIYAVLTEHWRRMSFPFFTYAGMWTIKFPPPPPPPMTLRKHPPLVAMAVDDTTYDVNLKRTDGHPVFPGMSKHLLWYWSLSVCEQIQRLMRSSTKQLAMPFAWYRKSANDILVEEDAKCSIYYEWNGGKSL
jgi:hypothetical protein